MQRMNMAGACHAEGRPFKAATFVDCFSQLQQSEACHAKASREAMHDVVHCVSCLAPGLDS